MSLWGQILSWPRLYLDLLTEASSPACTCGSLMKDTSPRLTFITGTDHTLSLIKTAYWPSISIWKLCIKISLIFMFYVRISNQTSKPSEAQ